MENEIRSRRYCTPYLERVENWLAIGTQLQSMTIAYVALLEILQVWHV